MSIESLSRRLAKVERARMGSCNALRCVGRITSNSDEEEADQIAAIVTSGTYDPANPTHLLISRRIVDPSPSPRPHA